ncbi:MAG: diacylglycerol kinase family lipid kinase [Thermoplasmatales archaeon]|nr:diacylglycerol kinase family lipid kinase [Thermoplasmatales archaeon]MCW6170747.1 diacylglycerol kinase family lipid kinase [Thermoplasmatales archaeon]
MRAFFIVNPEAGNGRALSKWNEYRKIIFEAMGSQPYEFTKRKGDATEIAKKISEGEFDVVVSCGGDGTLNEVVNGTIGTGINLAVLPIGTGSDFGKTLGIRNALDFLKAIKNGKTRAVDVLAAQFSNHGKRYFINILEIGFGAEIMNFVNSHKYFGNRSFEFGAFYMLSRMHPFNLILSIDSKEYKFLTIETIIANGRYFGGGMLASPDSEIDDSFMDVHILKPFSRFKSALNFRSLANGSYIEKGYAHNFKVKNISITSKDQLVEMDGEVIGKTPVDIYVESKIRFLEKLPD